MLSSWRMYEMHLALFLKAGCDNFWKESEGITGKIFVGYFKEDCGENIDHYILFVDINSQTNILK
jgi:hypothetical protein